MVKEYMVEIYNGILLSYKNKIMPFTVTWMNLEIVFFGKLSIYIFHPFFDWVEFYFYFFFISSCMNCLYILRVDLLLVTWFANIFSHSMGCLFVLFMVSIALQELLSLIRLNLFIFVFIFITLGDGSKKIMPQFITDGVLLIRPVFLTCYFGSY